jgi:hypothetical protein
MKNQDFLMVMVANLRNLESRSRILSDILHHHEVRTGLGGLAANQGQSV